MMAVVTPGPRVHIMAALVRGTLPTDVVAAMALGVMSAPVVRAGAMAAAVTAAVSPSTADSREKQRGSRDHNQDGCHFFHRRSYYQELSGNISFRHRLFEYPNHQNGTPVS